MAKFIDVSPRRLRQLVQEGIVPKHERGRYNPIEVNLAYIRFLRDRANTPEWSDSEMFAAKLGKLKAERAQIQIDIECKRKTRIPIDDVLEAHDELFKSTVGQLKAHRGKILTVDLFNEIMAEWRAAAKDMRDQSDLGNGQTAADRPPGEPWPDGPI
jgi:hypothetical protein